MASSIHDWRELLGPCSVMATWLPITPREATATWLCYHQLEATSWLAGWISLSFGLIRTARQCMGAALAILTRVARSQPANATTTAGPS